MTGNITIGSDNFRHIRTQNSCYVDKTHFLEEFINSGPNYVSLFTRPRRFGKSLALSMMNEFFDCQKDSSDIFNGLYIYENKEFCSNWMNKFPVIYLRFKDLAGIKFDVIYELLMTELSDAVMCHTYLFDNKNIDETYLNELEAIKNKKATDGQITISLHVLSRCLYTHHGVKPILLIDEYDYPLLKSYHCDYNEEITDVLRLLLSKTLKSNDFLQFAVLTGCTRISNESILTGINNLKHFDISSRRFADAFGFTEEEVYNLLEQYGIEDKLNQVRTWYNGYNFGNTAEIYNPWSIVNYIQDHQEDKNIKPRTYWIDTSANQFAYEILEKNTEVLSLDIDNLLKGQTIYKVIDNQLTYMDMKNCEDSTFWSIMYAAGYLTTAHEIHDVADTKDEFDECNEINVPLKIPNKEVYEMWRRRVLSYFKNTMGKYSFAKFNEAFWDGSDKTVESELTKFMTYSLSTFDVGEYIYHVMLLTILSGCYKAKSNRESALGRYDIEVRDCDEFHKTGAIIEIKRANSAKQLEKLAQQTLKQISDKKYDFNLRTDGYKTILHWGIAFHGKECRAIVHRITNARAYKRLPASGCHRTSDETAPASAQRM